VGLQMFSMEGNSTVERDTTVIWRLLPHLRRLYHLHPRLHHLHHLHRTLITRILVKVSAANQMEIMG